jgi:hypothetical protein
VGKQDVPGPVVGSIVHMEETMHTARKSILLVAAALALLTSLSGCIIEPGRYHDGGGWHQSHWSGGGWNHYH